MRSVLYAFAAALCLLFLSGCAPEPAVMMEALPAGEDVIALPSLPVPLAVEEVNNSASSSASDDLRMVSVSAFQFGYEPDRIEVEFGDDVLLTVTSLDVGHGFALPEFGINERVPPEESVTVRFTADQSGEFRFFNSVYSGSGWKDMEGSFIVR